MKRRLREHLRESGRPEQAAAPAAIAGPSTITIAPKTTYKAIAQARARAASAAASN